MRNLPLVVLLPALMAGCANMDSKTQSAGIGALIGCAAGAALAKATDNNAAQACAAGAVVGGVIGYQKARNQEIADAREAAAAAERVKGAKVAPVRTEAVKVKDTATGKTETVQAFKSVSVDIPVSQLDTAEGKEAMRKLDSYARRAAEQRGETITMNIAAAPGTAGKIGVDNRSVVEKVGDGAVRRTTTVDGRIPPGVQRVTIEARNPSAVSV